MKCGSCKADGPAVTVAHVKACYGAVYDEIDPTRRRPAATPAAPPAAPPLLPDLERNPFVRAWRKPVTQPHAFVPAARYAVGPCDRTMFVKVDRPTEGRWAGRVFVKVLASDTEHPLRDRVARDRVLAEIGADVDHALRRYGREIGSCGHCGRTLTNADSRSQGIGPVCAGRWAAAA